jgi:putative membrane protein
LLHVTNTNDIEGGRVAQDLATDPQVKAFAGRMAVDHLVMLRDSDGLAERLNITPWLSPPARALALNHGVAMEALRSRAGIGFDRAYLDHEIAMHRMVMASLDTAGGANPEIKRILDQALPALHAHLKAAQDLRDALNTRPRPVRPNPRAAADKKVERVAKGIPCGALQQTQRDVGQTK